MIEADACKLLLANSNLYLANCFSSFLTEIELEKDLKDRTLEQGKVLNNF